MDSEALVDYLARQRWFAGKGREWHIAGTATLGWLRRELPSVRVQVVDVRYATGDSEAYQLAVVERDTPVEYLAHALIGERDDEQGRRLWLYDALHDKEVTGLWMQGIAESWSLESMVFHHSPTARQIPPHAPSLVIGAEQSNTSLVFGDVAILKVFRKLSHGPNPDIEVHEALAAAGSTHVAEPLGWLEGTWTDPATGRRDSGSLAMMQVFLRNATEGWELAKASVRDLFAEEDLHADEVGGDFAGEAERLGVATAEVHLDLARTLGSTTLGQDHLGAIATAMRSRLERAATEVEPLGRFLGPLRAAYDDLANLSGPISVQRVHGDYHLGQVMRTLDGWRLLDFEGEPAKPLEDRRAADSPLKDVAGMLRSLDYAARHLLADRHVEPYLEYRAAEWADRNRDAFCTGYGKAYGRDPREDAVLLTAFETDKAVYEVVYEARHRPTWLRIPLSAIERLAAAR